MSRTQISEFSRLKGRVLLAFVLMVSMVGGCAVWAMQAKISGAVIASGKVVVRAQIKEVQHSHGGIVSEILVSDGEYVEKGAVLVRLDETQVKSELGVLAAQISEFTARASRLRAERDDQETIVFPAGFENDPRFAEIADGERRLHLQSRETLSVQKDQLRNRIEQFHKEINGLAGQRASLDVELGILEAELDRNEQLLEKRLIQQSQVTALQRDAIRMHGQISENEAATARVKGQISEAKLSIIDIENRARTEAHVALRDIEAKLKEANEREIAARDQLLRTEIRSPISGTVNGLSVHTIGGVVAAGETIMGVVPDGELVVEAQLMTTDVDQVRPGQIVNLRFSAFNQRTTPEFKGEVLVVSAAAIVDPASGLPHYLSTIGVLDPDALIGDKSLVPGMPVEVFFETGERTAMSYLIKPFTDQMERAFREE